MDELGDSAERFLCNDHPRPRVLERMFNVLLMSEKPTSRTGLAQELGLPEENMPFFILELLNLVRPADGGLEVDRELTHRFDSLDDSALAFRCLLLNRIAERSWRGNGFSKQAHFLLIYEWLVQQDPPVIDFKRADLIDKVDKYFVTRGYRPMSAGKVPRTIKMNDVKLSYWTILASYIGLVMRGPEGKQSLHLAVLDPTLLEVFLQVYRNERRRDLVTFEKSTYIGLEGFLDWSAKKFLMIPILPGRVFPQTISDALLRLSRKGVIRPAKVGDMQSYSLPGLQPPNQDEMRYNALEIVP